MINEPVKFLVNVLRADVPKLIFTSFLFRWDGSYPYVEVFNDKLVLNAFTFGGKEVIDKSSINEITYGSTVYKKGDEPYIIRIKYSDIGKNDILSLIPFEGRLFRRKYIGQKFLDTLRKFDYQIS